MKALFLSAAIAFFGFSFSATAGTPEVKTAKAETPAPKATTESTTTYYVVGQSGTNYTISSNPADDPGCSEGTLPCKFTSPDPSLGTSVPKSMVDNQEEEILILEYRPS